MESAKGHRVNGGHNYYVFSVAVALSSYFVNTSVVSFAYPGTASNVFSHSNAIARTYVLPKSRFVQHIAMGLKVFAHLLNFRPTNILCTHPLPILLSVWLYATISRTPYVVSIHSDMVSCRWKPERVLVSQLLKRAAAIICHGPYLSCQIRHSVGHPNLLEYRASCSDLLRFSELANRELESKCGRGYILYTGRIIKGKGVFDLLEASADLLASAPGLKLVYAGSGSEERRLREMAALHQQRNQIIILGRVSRRDIGWLIKHATLVVTPTRTEFPEGLCMSAIEAIALGVPLLAPAFGPFEHIVTNGDNGLLFQPDSVENLREKLVQICTDNAVRAVLASGAIKKSSSYLSDSSSYDNMVLKAFSVGANEDSGMQ